MNVQCAYCDENAARLMPQSVDRGVTVKMVPCCKNHASDWWEGADWDGNALEVDLNKGLLA